MSSGTSQMNNQGQQWPSVGSVNTNSHMELLATLSVIFIFILITIHLYARYRRREESVTITIHHSRHPSATAPPPEGLDAAAIAALPKFIHRTRSSPTHSVEECAVCLNAAEEGEVMRMLPDCKHVFHIDCIDMWLHSHSTCPVCRTKATPGMVKIEFGGLLAAPPLPERIVVGGSTSAAETYGPKEGSSSQASNAGNGTRTWLASVDEGVVDLERQ